MRVSLAQWLKDNEAAIVPTWIRAVRQRSERDRTLTTQQLGQGMLLSYFDCFVKAAATGGYGELEALVEQMAIDRASRQYNLDDLLLIPLLLRETIWTGLAASVSPTETMELVQAAQPIFEHSLTTLVRTFAGVTAQELERRVKERTQELERANRDLSKLDKTKSDFISIAAHELKTPLTLIQGYADILLREDRSTMPGEYINDVLRGIIKGTKRLQSIIEDMIDMSLIDSQVLTLRLEPVFVGTIIELAVGELGAAARERKQTITVEAFTGIPRIQGDPQRLYKVFLNVIGNGIKCTPDGGHVTISGGLLKAQGALKEDFVEIIVADTGIGIDKEDLEYIFDKFYRTGPIALHSTGKIKFKGAGTGLGLAIAKGIVEAHGGIIWAESEGYDEILCPGSQFHILLPVKAKKVPGAKVVNLFQCRADK